MISLPHLLVFNVLIIRAIVDNRFNPWTVVEADCSTLRGNPEILRLWLLHTHMFLELWIYHNSQVLFLLYFFEWHLFTCSMHCVHVGGLPMCIVLHLFGWNHSCHFSAQSSTANRPFCEDLHSSSLRYIMLTFVLSAKSRAIIWMVEGRLIT